MKKITLLVIFLAGEGFLFSAYSQDLGYVKKTVGRLASAEMAGRGYVKQGDAKAAAFIASEYKNLGLKRFDTSYYQFFNFGMNTFPGKVEISVDGRLLVPGKDFLVNASSQGTKGNFKVIREAKLSETGFPSQSSGKVLLIDSGVVSEKNFYKKSFQKSSSLPKAVIYLIDSNLTWGAWDGQQPIPMISARVMRSAMPANAKKVKILVETRYNPSHQTQNVVGYIRGKQKPDSFIVITAHYDHLGMMGPVLFPGANDNASGVAMMLDIARHYLQENKQPKYTMVFIACAGEEAGLLGSNYFSQHPLISLAKIKFLINLDMIGTGSQGLKVVNGTIYTEAFNRLDSLNKTGNYITTVGKRGEAAISDHHPFYKKGVPCFYIYTQGREYTEYHNPNDLAEKVPFTAYESLFRLLTSFIESF